MLSQVNDNNMAFGEIGGGGTRHSSSSSYKYNADDDDDGDGDGYTNLNRMEFIVDEERQSAEAPTQRPTDLLEINFAPGYWKGVGRYWTGKIRERPPRSQLWRRMQKVYVYTWMCMCMCMCICMRVCVRACVGGCVGAWMRAWCVGASVRACVVRARIGEHCCCSTGI